MNAPLCTICCKPMKSGQEIVCSLGKKAWAVVVSDGEIIKGYHRLCFDEQRDLFDNYETAA